VKEVIEDGFLIYPHRIVIQTALQPVRAKRAESHRKSQQYGRRSAPVHAANSTAPQPVQSSSDMIGQSFGERKGGVAETGDLQIYKVVVNKEEQYSIWPADRETPLGWKDTGKSGAKAECLAYIEEVWTDMRPLSLREAMEKAAGGS